MSVSMLNENRSRRNPRDPLTLSIENVDKEFWQCYGERIRWGYITDKYRKTKTLSVMKMEER